MEVGLDADDFVLDGDRTLPLKRGQNPPNFRPMSIVAKRLDDQDDTWYGGRPRPRLLCVRLESSSRQKRGHSPLPQFSAHVYCGQMAWWIKMLLGREVDLGSGNIVLDGDQIPPQRGIAPTPIFGPCLLWPNRCASQLLLSSCQLSHLYLVSPLGVTCVRFAEIFR